MIQEHTTRSEELIDFLVEIWYASVKATHTFLSEKEILTIKEYVPEALAGIPVLATASSPDGSPLGFIGLDGTKVEMLFLNPDMRGQGLGRLLLTWAIENYGTSELAVNEANPEARGFYEHMGFRVVSRSETDDQGGSYPILVMKRES